MSFGLNMFLACNIALDYFFIFLPPCVSWLSHSPWELLWKILTYFYHCIISYIWFHFSPFCLIAHASWFIHLASLFGLLGFIVSMIYFRSFWSAGLLVMNVLRHPLSWKELSASFSLFFIYLLFTVGVWYLCMLHLKFLYIPFFRPLFISWYRSQLQ